MDSVRGLRLRRRRIRDGSPLMSDGGPGPRRGAIRARHGHAVSVRGLRQGDATLGFEIGNDEFVLLAFGFVFIRTLGNKRLSEQEQQENELFHACSYT